MSITTLRKREDLSGQSKLNQIYTQLDGLINELNTKNLSNDIIGKINKEIEAINATTRSGNSLKRFMLKKQSKIVKLIEKKLKLVPKNYYRNLWLVLGMAVFGIPIGVALSAGNGDMGSIAIGLPIGLAIGIAVGSGMDKKAFKDGRQLNTELKSEMC